MVLKGVSSNENSDFYVCTLLLLLVRRYYRMNWNVFAWNSNNQKYKQKDRHTHTHAYLYKEILKVHFLYLCILGATNPVHFYRNYMKVFHNTCCLYLRQAKRLNQRALLDLRKISKFNKNVFELSQVIVHQK